MSDLYDSDIVTWSDRQADLLRRVAAGEVRGFRAQARRRYKPPMSQKLDIPGLYKDALQRPPRPSMGSRRNPCPHPARSRWTS
jgi:hypothetical protein